MLVSTNVHRDRYKEDNMNFNGFCTNERGDQKGQQNLVFIEALITSKSHCNFFVIESYEKAHATLDLINVALDSKIIGNYKDELLNLDKFFVYFDTRIFFILVVIWVYNTHKQMIVHLSKEQLIRRRRLLWSDLLRYKTLVD